MASPAEAHAEMEADHKAAALKTRVERQHDGLIAILHSSGFGPIGREASWAENQLREHLAAALALTELMMRANR